MNTLQAVTLMTVSSLWIVGCPVQMPGVDVVLGDARNGEDQGTMDVRPVGLDADDVELADRVEIALPRTDGSDVGLDGGFVPTAAGDSRIVTIPNSSGGTIAVKVLTPAVPRYAEGAGVFVEANVFFTGTGSFYTSVNGPAAGLVQITYLWPGNSDPSGARSSGVYQHGGPTDIAALRDVLRFAANETRDADGRRLSELLAFPIVTGEVGLYAFSHPGIAAVNVLALHGAELGAVKWFVGRENPTTDTLSSVEVGYWDSGNRAVLNPLYAYPGDYTASDLRVDYSTIRYDSTLGVPYFDMDGSGTVTASDHVLGNKIPEMFGKKMYSEALTSALEATGLSPWPAELGTALDARALWPFRESPARYPSLRTQTPNLHALLVFADRDHVQPAADKPHIHMAYEGFRSAGLWTRLNPDAEYLAWAYGSNPVPMGGDVEANRVVTQDEWRTANRFSVQSAMLSTQLVPLAAVAEMADRTRLNRWDTNLSSVLLTAPTPSP